jgi:IS30 family transposase
MDFSLDTIKSNVDRITKISTSDRQKSLRWLSRQNDLIVYDVFKLQKSHFHRLKSQNIDKDLVLLSVASLFLSLRETISASNPVKRKNRSADFNFLRQISKNRAKQFRKARKKVKYEKLLDLQSVIYSLATIEKFSTREISKYLLKHHRLEISHTSISKFLKQIKESNHD